MTTYIVMTRDYPHKKTFKEAVKLGRNVRMLKYEPNGGTHYVSLRDVHDQPGHSFTVTDMQRNWFAAVTVGPDRKLKVT